MLAAGRFGNRASPQGCPHTTCVVRDIRELFQNCHDLEKMDLEECVLVSGPPVPCRAAPQSLTNSQA